MVSAPLDPEDWWRVTRYRIAKDTGWTLEYIEELPLSVIGEFEAIEQALNLYSKNRRKK